MGALDRDVRIAGQNLALESLQAGGHPAADLADADHTGDLAFQLMAGKGGALPFAGF